MCVRRALTKNECVDLDGWLEKKEVMNCELVDWLIALCEKKIGSCLLAH